MIINQNTENFLSLSCIKESMILYSFSRLYMERTMKSVQFRVAKVSSKAPTGIIGFDEITGGGLPRGRTTLLTGGPGSGKTIFGLQFLVHGTQEYREPGIFVAFEENSKRILANAASFGWKLPELRRKKLFFLDAQPMYDQVQSGDFDIRGMLAALETKTHEIGARRIVFDALNIVLAQLPDSGAKRRELYRLHEWLLAHELTGLITLQSAGDESRDVEQQSLGFIQFMVDCAVVLHHRVIDGLSQRNLRVQKYRGSGFDEDEAPFRIGKSGLEVAAKLKRLKLDVDEAELKVRLKALQLELEAKQVEKKRLSSTIESSRENSREAAPKGKNYQRLMR